MAITSGPSFQLVLEELFLAPVRHTELLPSLLPIILGALVIELYFGKYTNEQLGWNTSVGNAVIWMTTGANLLINSSLEPIEQKAAFFLIGVGGIVGYMDFFHKWSEGVAFIISSSGIVYSLAYVTVVIVQTDIPINSTSLKAAGAFIIGINFLFKIIQSIETSRDDFSIN